MPKRIAKNLGLLALRSVEALWVLIAIVAAWQIWISFAHVPRIVAPAPLDVVHGALQNWQVLLTAAYQTMGIALSGLVIGSLLGYILALLSWVSVVIGGLILPGALIAQSVPIVAMVPVIARVMGYDTKAVLAIAVLISFFPTYVLVRGGFDRPPAGSNDLLTVFGATRLQRLTTLAIPSAMPSLLTAVRLSAANCILATLVAEFLMGTQGLGFLVAFSAPRMDLQTGWAAATIAVVLSVLMFTVFSALEEKWRERWT